MKLTKCPNGHFYDEEKYSVCPHCRGGNNGIADDMATESFAYSGMETVGNNAGYGGFGDDDVTVSNVRFDTGNNIESVGSAYAQRQNSRPDMQKGTFRTSEDDERTVGFINWNAMRANEEKYQKEGKNVRGDDQRREKVNPVVGWLVCTSGSNYGKSFCLYSGKNFIGRDISNDICLQGDMGISRVKHAVIIYEPIQRQFFAQPGDSSHELFYLNNKVVLSNTLISDRDIITLGQNTLVFVPFCDEKYGWDVSRDE